MSVHHRRILLSSDAERAVHDVVIRPSECANGNTGNISTDLWRLVVGFVAESGLEYRNIA